MSRFGSTRLSRRLAAVGAAALVGSLLLGGAPALAANPVLGAARSTVEKEIGKPDPEISNLPEVAGYVVPNYGGYSVGYYNDRAVEITLISNRDPNLQLTESDPKDWAVSTADSKSKTFLPADASCSPKQDLGDRIQKVCTSKTLAKNVPEGDLYMLGVYGAPGDITVTYFLNYEGKVPAIDIIVGSPADYVASGATTSSTTTTTAAAATKAPSSASTSSTSSRSSSSGSSTGNRLSCKYFLSQPEAQYWFDSNGGNSNPLVAMLDGDKDGIACEYLPSGQ